MASGIESANAGDPSKQAIAQRFSPAFELFIQALIGQVIAMKIEDDVAGGNAVRHDFRGNLRVLVQDSTIIKLPIALFAEFSGVSNAHATVCNARIQAVYDLISGKLISFSIDSYSKNDLRAAPELELKEGDLVLRDRGYLSADEMQRHIDAGADFIYRHKTGVNYLDEETKQPIDLPALLKGRGRLDMDVLLNNKQRTRVRLVAAPVSQECANLRRRKAKKDSCGHNPSKAVLELMDWTIFITSIPAAKASFEELLGIYGLRWRIEVIFKAWKSHLKFDMLHRVSARQMRILLTVRLLIIAAASTFYRRIEQMLWHKYRRRLSLLKFMKYLSASPKRLKRIIDYLEGALENTIGFEKAMARYCCYDKRKKNLNFNELWELLALS